MTDRELLELAAKAAVMDCRMRYCEAWAGMALYTPQDGYFGPTWNPLTDDGDALRLAVKLSMLDGVGLSMFFADKDDPTVVVRAYDGTQGSMEKIGNDHYAATRRAIVRAAAEIGKAMQ